MSISEIELSVPPGGGLASAQTVTITVAESGAGQDLLTTWNDEGRMQGVDLTVSLLPQGETYGNKIPYFTGKIDAASWADGIGTLVAVDDTLHKDIQLPQTILTTDRYPNLPDQSRGAIVPLLYGSATVLGFAPLLMVDPLTNTYIAADHALGTMGNVHAVAIAENTRYLSVVGLATSDPVSATMTLLKPVTETRYTIPGITQNVSQVLNVTNPGSLLDGNTATLTVIGTGSLNSEGDGYGRIAVTYTWPIPDGANTGILTVWNHRRTPGAATTVTAEVIVRSIDPVTNAIQRNNLFRDGPYRHQSNARTREVTIAPLVVVSPGALEVELEVLNEGGVGAVGDTWDVAEFSFTLFYQADNLFTPVYLASPFEGRADISGLITGVPGQTLTHAVDVLHSILRDRLTIPVQPTSFPATRAALVTYAGSQFRFDFGLGSGGWHQTQMTASALLDTLALQANCYLYPVGDGSIAIGRSRDTMVDQLALSMSNMANIQVDLGRLELVHSTFEVRYAWSLTLQRFTKVALATPEGCNHPNGPTSAALFERCNDSFQRYGPQQPYILDAYAIQDDATAFTALTHLVNYYWTQQCIVTCDIPYIGAHLEVGDYVSMTYPEIPVNESGGLFELVRITHRPHDGNSASWPMQLVAMRTLLASFDYFAINDQDSITWYWWINRAGELDWSLNPPFTAIRIAEDLELSPIPFWLQVTDPDGNVRYIFPSTITGEPDVSETQPVTGTGYLGSPVMRSQGVGRYLLDVPRTREVRVIQLRPSFDYFVIFDQLGVPWYWWINRAGEQEAGLSPPSLNTRIAEDLALSPTPSWLVLTNPSLALRYVYPSALTGEPLISTTGPSVGVGRTGSPILRSMGTGVWQFIITAAEELFITGA